MHCTILHCSNPKFTSGSTATQLTFEGERNAEYAPKPQCIQFDWVAKQQVPGNIGTGYGNDTGTFCYPVRFCTQQLMRVCKLTVQP